MSYDFWDDGAEQMLEDQKKEIQAVTYLPICQTWEIGTYIFRIYPENYKGKPRMMRTVWCQKLHNFKRVLGTKEDTRIKDLLEETKAAGHDQRKTGLWMHRSNQETILMVEMYSCPDGKHTKKGTTALILDRDKATALNSFLDSLGTEGVSLKSFLHPGKPNAAIKMNVSKVTNGKKTETKINFSATVTSEYVLNASIQVGLPEDIEFTGLDDVYVKEGTFLTDEEWTEFKAYVAKKINESSAQMPEHNPEDSFESGYKAEFANLKKEPKKTAEPVTKVDPPPFNDTLDDLPFEPEAAAETAPVTGAITRSGEDDLEDLYNELGV